MVKLPAAKFSTRNSTPAFCWIQFYFFRSLEIFVVVVALSHTYTHIGFSIFLFCIYGGKLLHLLRILENKAQKEPTGSAKERQKAKKRILTMCIVLEPVCVYIRDLMKNPLHTFYVLTRFYIYIKCRGKRAERKSFIIHVLHPDAFNVYLRVQPKCT